MFDDPVAPMRRRIPTGPAITPHTPAPAVPTTPFAARYGVPADTIFNAASNPPPTKTTVCRPTQVSGDGNNVPPRADDVDIAAND